jgi:hypothetical protein
VIFQPRLFHAPVEGTKVGPHFFHPSKFIHRQHAMQFALSLILTCGLICNGFFFTKVSGFQVPSVLQILGSKQLPLLNKFWVMGITDSRALPLDLVWHWIWYEGTADVGAYSTWNRGWRWRSWEPRVKLEVQGVMPFLERSGSWEVLGTEGGARGGPKCKRQKGLSRWLNCTED